MKKIIARTFIWNAMHIWWFSLNFIVTGYSENDIYFTQMYNYPDGICLDRSGYRYFPSKLKNSSWVLFACILDKIYMNCYKRHKLHIYSKSDTIEKNSNFEILVWLNHKSKFKSDIKNRFRLFIKMVELWGLIIFSYMMFIIENLNVFR